MILIINICKEIFHELEFVKPIEDILKDNSINFNTKHYLNLTESDIKTADKIIICGTSLKDNEFLNHVDKFDFLLKFNKPVLGICGGSHIIGLLLGYEKKEQKEIGMKELELKDEFLGVRGWIQVYHLHQLCVLPEVFHKDNFYSVLFHPEVRNKEMIVNFCINS